MWRVGLISDTHDYFDPLLPQCFDGVDHILHAGDIGSLAILNRLERIAPVTAVAGNCDPGLALPYAERIHLAQRTVYLQHILNPHALSEEWLRDIHQSGVRVVVFGHSHRAFCQELDGVLFANPGYAGKVRFHLPRSVAILSLDGPRAEIVFRALP
jgi:uncharacterized protein